MFDDVTGVAPRCGVCALADAFPGEKATRLAVMAMAFVRKWCLCLLFLYQGVLAVPTMLNA